ncbi:MAG TPA: aminoacyl-tRNA hydrolase [Gemmatales bacterium]|nr:aminoacyl-tRNA hydrolase [Gemmatales bacterium]
MKLIVGLGNPGSQYTGTRHNVGFEVIDILVSGPGGGKYQRKFEGDLAEAYDGLDKVLYLKPLTFMNLSGRSVRAALDFYKLTPADVLVVCDDINLPLGQLRLRPTGSAGGHNGLKDIERQLGTQTYARLRIGVGGPHREDLVDHVLGRFKPSERDVVNDTNIRAAQAVVCWMREGTETAMNRFNAPEREPKPKKPRPDKKQETEAKDASVPAKQDVTTPRGAADQTQI